MRSFVLTLALAMAAVLSVGLGATPPNEKASQDAKCVLTYPREFGPLFESGEITKVVRLMETRLNENLGKPMPDLNMTTGKGRKKRFEDLRGSRAAYFVLPAHLDPAKFEEWVRDLESNGWRTQDGREAIVVLYADVKHPTVDRLRRKENVVFAERPFAGFLRNVVLFPLILLVSPEVTFEGFARLPEEV